MTAPQDIAAQDFMDRKGIPWARPKDIDKLEGKPCWYYLYELGGGTLELEVYWNGEEWETTVCTFRVAN